MPAQTAESARPVDSRRQDVDPSAIARELTDWDHAAFSRLTRQELTPEEAQAIARPQATFPRQDAVLALHWHPEQVPLDVAAKRIAAMFPASRDSLVIPTQHNQLLAMGDYAGVEVDCYSRGFNRKVQLLVHFRADRLDRAGVLRSMLDHTYKYRATQLVDYLDVLAGPPDDKAVAKAAAKAGADEDVVEFCAIYARKIKKLILSHEAHIPADAFKNKLVRNYFDALREFYGAKYINKAHVYLAAAKQEVKDRFTLSYFYRTTEIIEEVRGLGGGVVIPHPEQFWPILLADYDIDGIEVWNPQSQQYTEFLINVVNRRNRQGRPRGKNVLVFMGDDCHLSEKLKPKDEQDPEKAAREVGLQPAWDDLLIRKSLITAGVGRKTVMDEYRQRLA